MQEVYPGIFMVTEKGAWGVLKPSTNIYIIPGKGGIMYDAGYGSRKSFECNQNYAHSLCCIFNELK
jgi:hypothetical protein